MNIFEESLNLRIEEMKARQAARRAQLITAREAQAIYGVKQDTLKRWLHRGHLSAIRQGRRLLLFDRSAVENIVRERMPHLLARPN